MEYDALIIGSGPNGLAAAITLARAGLSVALWEANDTPGGGLRSAELTLPGFVHDVCSAIHPLAVASPFFRSVPLERLGVSWIEPDIALAHPLGDGSAAALGRDFEPTADSLGRDGGAWRKLMTPFVRNWDKLSGEFFQPILHWPRHPLLLAQFGLRGLCPATLLARSAFRDQAARALFAGIAAHSFLPLEAPGSAAFGLVLGAAAHVVNWPLPKGGSQFVANALGRYLIELGGVIETSTRVENLDSLPKARAILFDTSAWEFERIAGSALPHSYATRLREFQHAPAVFKIDYALSRPIPWRAEVCRRAGTVHLGGTLEEIAESEGETVRGRLSERPFVLVAQQSLFDETRAPAGRHTLWAYAHVPTGCDVDISDRIESQIERFAPGFRDCILARHKTNPAEIGKSNASMNEGDISGGAMTLKQLIARPTFSPTPYRTPLRGVYLCSSSTPPGGGVHGMCGYHAARAALREIFGKRLATDYTD